jgi:hypothetical protein
MRRRAEFEKLLIPRKKERSEFWDFRSSGCCLFVVREVDLEVNFPFPFPFPSTILADALALNLIFEAHCFVYLELGNLPACDFTFAFLRTDSFLPTTSLCSTIKHLGVHMKVPWIGNGKPRDLLIPNLHFPNSRANRLKSVRQDPGNNT